uniref:Uncharacterized protein n=1 Tax=Panagrolaimus superbus TaxID=310955 RepID=A0A914YC33_9BILA
MALLNVVNALIENNSERHRDYLLEKFYHLAEELGGSICIVGPNDAKLSSPRKDDRFYESVNDSDYHGTLYRFIENILILSYPDCEINSLNLKSASHVVDQCYDKFVIEIQDKSRKCLSSGRKFIIPKCRLPLLSRIFLLKHLLSIEDSLICGPRAAKKARTLSTLSQLVNDGQYCHFQIILEVVTSWRHRLRSEDLDDLVIDLVKVNRKILKKDDKLELFMRILGRCLIDKRDIASADYDELWNWAISLLQIPAIQEAACIAISGIIHYYEEVLTAKPDDLFKVLIFQIAQFSVYSKPVLDLIHLVITKFEFDERASFRVDLQISIPEWTFRSQLLYAILKFSPYNENVENLIMAVINYHPQEVHSTNL